MLKRSEFERRKFEDNSSQIGSLFLQSVPCDPHSTFSDVEFSSSLACRLLTKVEVCRKCDQVVEEGHEQGCQYQHGLRVKRHEMVKFALARALRDAGAETTMEVVAENNEGRRCDFIAKGQLCGGTLAFDVTGVATNRIQKRVPGSGFDKSAAEIKAIIEARVEKKMRENQGLNYGGEFFPFVFTSGGTINGEASDFLKDVQKDHHRDKKTHGTIHRLKHTCRVFWRKAEV